MYEVLQRCGLARAGHLVLDRFDGTTPNVLFVRTKGSPPMWAELFLASQRGVRSLAVQTTGPGPEFPLSRPLSLESVTFPTQEGTGDIAFLADPREGAETDREVVSLQNMVEYLRYPKKFVGVIRTLRKSVGYQKVIFTPLLATPANLCLLVYCGVDLVDSLRAIHDSGRGIFHMGDGAEVADELVDWPCFCPSCARRDLLGHNLRTLMTELRRVRAAVRSGNLRELVERRVANDPWMTAVLREMDYRSYDWQELHYPVVGAPMRAYSSESLYRPDVVRYRRRLMERYRKPPSAQVLLLLPCSARKPYSTSRSHRLFRSVIRGGGNPWAVHVVVVTSPLGLVPMELELSYPAQSYDVPVTGDWSENEASILREGLASYLKHNAYESVIVHLGSEAEVLEPILDRAIVTSRADPRSQDSLERLRKALVETTSPLAIVPSWKRHAEDHVSRARFQFGEAGEALVEGCSTRGRYPNLRLLREGRQMAALSGDRGMYSITLEGGQVLAERGSYWVEIDDFYPEGNVFAVGVLDADAEIRVGDDVVVRHSDEVRVVGVARMNPVEMVESSRGEAVHVRHKLKQVQS